MRRLFLVAALLGGAHVALAQPTPPPDKTDAQALVASGMKLFGAKDYLGALAVFRDAYARFPSTKILLNIATTLARLDRPADAANTYQRYLDAPDADPAKRAGVQKALADLDRNLAILTIDVTPDDAEIQLAGGDWLPAHTVAHYRVAPGDIALGARRSGYAPAGKSVHVDAGGELAVTFTLVANPSAAGAGPGSSGVRPMVDPDSMPRFAPPPAAPRHRLGVIALAHVAVEHPGVAGLVGLTFDARRWLELEATALIGKTSGGYAAVAVLPWGGRYRPFAVAGVPIFVSDGARVSIRGGLGLEAVLSRRVSIVAEVGVERALNAQAGVEKTVLVPALGLTGRI